MFNCDLMCKIRTVLGYVFGCLVPDPASASIPHHHQGAPQSKAYRFNGGMNRSIHSTKSIKDVGPLTWVKSINTKSHSPAIGKTKYILPTAMYLFYTLSILLGLFCVVTLHPSNSDMGCLRIAGYGHWDQSRSASRKPTL